MSTSIVFDPRCSRCSGFADALLDGMVHGGASTPGDGSERTNVSEETTVGSEVSEIPRGFIPWSEVHGQIGELELLLPLLGVVLGALAYHWLLAPWLWRLKEKRRWVHFDEHARQTGLSKAEAAFLGRVLRETGCETPESALTVRSYFDAFAAPELRRHFGAGPAVALETKLFLAPATPPAGDTHDLCVGDQLYLKVQEYPGHFDAMVVGTEAKSFVATIPDRFERESVWTTGDRLQGSYVYRNGLYVFDSVAAEVLAGVIVGCRIPHALAREVHRRQGPRLPVMRAIRLRCLTESLSPGRAQVRLVALEKRPAVERDAILCEIGADGCSIEIGPGHVVVSGTLVEFPLNFPDLTSPPVVLGAVVKVGHDADQRMLLHVEFVGLSEAAQRILALRIESADESQLAPEDNCQSRALHLNENNAPKL